MSGTDAAIIEQQKIAIETLLNIHNAGTRMALADTALQPKVAGSGIGGGGFAEHFLAAGAAAGDVTVTGIKLGDELEEVVYFVGAGVAVTDVLDLTAEFTITADGKINNTGHTSSSGGKLMVRWTKLTA